MLRYLAMSVRNREYDPVEVRNTLTVGQLIEQLKHWDEDMKIVTSFDDGYMYGPIFMGDFEEVETEYDISNDRR